MSALSRLGVIVGTFAAAAVVLFGAYVMFVILPVLFYTDAECLRNGYPKARVSVGLERYCTTLDGAVTVRVEKLP